MHANRQAKRLRGRLLCLSWWAYTGTRRTLRRSSNDPHSRLEMAAVGPLSRIATKPRLRPRRRSSEATAKAYQPPPIGPAGAPLLRASARQSSWRNAPPSPPHSGGARRLRRSPSPAAHTPAGEEPDEGRIRCSKRHRYRSHGSQTGGRPRHGAGGHYAGIPYRCVGVVHQPSHQCDLRGV